jgi:LmbE family N-acetylglucosaminyl deacetylase
VKIFVSPHNDDAVLFGAFTLMREKPTVLTVFDSHVQVLRGHSRCDSLTRRAEDIAAVWGVLGCDMIFGGVRDDSDPASARAAVRDALTRWKASEVWIPQFEEGGHEQHNLIAEIGFGVFERAKIHRYLTYTRGGKSTNGTPVECTGPMVLKKLQALACYKTQLEISELWCWPHFVRDQNEYLAAS